MSLFHAFDASTPPDVAPPGYQAVMGYIGGETPHVWTPAEWRRFAHLRQLPIWVARFTEPAVSEAVEAAGVARELGWNDNGTRAILGDFEDVTDPRWIAAWGHEIVNWGYIPWGYESANVRAANPPLLGLVIAQWNGIPNVPRPDPPIIGHQYDHDRPWHDVTIDLDVFDSTVWDHFGFGPRKG